MLFNHQGKLLEQTSAINTQLTGDGHALLENRQGLEQSFKVWFDLEQSGGATSPTVKARLQTSWDKVHWATVVESTELSADGTLSEWKDAADLGPFVRATTVLGGGTLPNHKATVVLLSHADFKLKK